MKDYKPTVVFDFDGVIHSYISGWQGETNIPDPPVNGIGEAIKEIRTAGYGVVVVSTRCATSAGIKAVNEWLIKNGIMVDSVMREKPPAIVYIDDRAICFDGKPENLLSQITCFMPWYNQPPRSVVYLSVDEVFAANHDIPPDRLEQLCAAEKDGRCDIRPCKIGDTVYLANRVEKRICECVCTEIRQVECGWYALGVDKETSFKYSLFFDTFGKTVFLTRAEAAAALERTDRNG